MGYKSALGEYSNVSLTSVRDYGKALDSLFDLKTTATKEKRKVEKRARNHKKNLGLLEAVGAIVGGIVGGPLGSSAIGASLGTLAAGATYNAVDDIKDTKTTFFDDTKSKLSDEFFNTVLEDSLKNLVIGKAIGEFNFEGFTSDVGAGTDVPIGLPMT